MQMEKYGCVGDLFQSPCALTFAYLNGMARSFLDQILAPDFGKMGNLRRMLWS